MLYCPEALVFVFAVWFLTETVTPETGFPLLSVIRPDTFACCANKPKGAQSRERDSRFRCIKRVLVANIVFSLIFIIL
ncbi:hypothetical protein D3C73_713740 [compost metagenome]